MDSKKENKQKETKKVEEAARQEYAMSQWALGQEYAKSQWDLGYGYFKGIGVRKDYRQAFKCFQKINPSDILHIAINRVLGNMYYYGKGIKKDLRMAFKHYEKGNEHIKLAQMYFKGEGVKKNRQKALKLCKKVDAESLYPCFEDMYTLGMICLEIQDYQKALESFHFAAIYRFLPARKQLKLLYFKSKDKKIKTACRKTFEHFQKLALDEQNLSLKSYYRKLLTGDAQNVLGDIYCNGYGVAKDYQEAFIWYRKSFQEQEKDDVYCGNALLDLGDIFAGKRDLQTALKCYRVVAKVDTIGGCKIADLYYAKKDYLKAFLIYKKTGHYEAIYKRGKMYFDGKGIEQNYQKAARIFMLIVGDDDFPYSERTKDAAITLGDMYFKGIGVRQDYRKAFKHYEKTAEQGYAIAQFKLGRMYLEGKGTEQDYIEALEFFHKAAANGNLAARKQLKKMYCEKFKAACQEVLKRFQEATLWGDEESQNVLGDIYRNGYGIGQNYQKALRYYREAAIGEFAENKSVQAARKALGDMYLKGEGVKMDYRKAFKFYEKAAEQGDAEAQFQLGQMYLKGEGIEKDEQEGLAWIRRAADFGGEDHV